MKFFYIASTSFAIFVITCMEPYKCLYDTDQDSFPIWMMAVLPCGVLAVAIYHYKRNYSGLVVYNFIELGWTISILLESIAIIPQLLVLRQYQLVENLTVGFVLCQGMYRGLYGVNWVYSAYTKPYYQHHYLTYICGFIQTLLYMDFAFQYYYNATTVRY